MLLKIYNKLYKNNMSINCSLTLSFFLFGVIKNDNIKCLIFLRNLINLCDVKYVCDIACVSGNLSLLKYIRKNKIRWNHEATLYAAKNGHLLYYVVNNGLKLHKNTSVFAADGGNLACLKYARMHGCKWDSMVTDYAAKEGNLDCLKYAHENGCCLSNCAMSYASDNGHLECLKYLHEHGCKPSPGSFVNMVQNGHLECIKYLLDNGHGITKDDYLFVLLGLSCLTQRHIDCLQYIYSHNTKS